MQGNLSPWVLSEKHMKCCFSLSIPYVRTNFSSEKLSCTRPRSAGTCFAKQSEQWTTSPRSVNEVKRTNFPSGKSSCTRPRSAGTCFAKQSEQWLTKPLLSQARLARACPATDLHSIKKFGFCHSSQIPLKTSLASPVIKACLLSLS